jgi:hypothetical protein
LGRKYLEENADVGHVGVFENLLLELLLDGGGVHGCGATTVDVV